MAKNDSSHFLCLEWVAASRSISNSMLLVLPREATDQTMAANLNKKSAAVVSRFIDANLDQLCLWTSEYMLLQVYMLHDQSRKSHGGDSEGSNELAKK